MIAVPTSNPARARAWRRDKASGFIARFYDGAATGTLLVTGDANGIVRVGPVSGGEPHLLFGQEIIGSIAVSRDSRWVAAGSTLGPNGETTTRLWRMPRVEPIQTLPLDRFLDHLRAQTNLRVVADATSPTGYRIDTGPFPGWERFPPE